MKTKGQKSFRQAEVSVSSKSVAPTSTAHIFPSLIGNRAMGQLLAGTKALPAVQSDKKQNQRADSSRSKVPSPEVNRQYRNSHALQRTLGNQAVQRMRQSCGREFGNKSVHEAATRGTQGSGKSLPFLSQIQRAFGRHDLSHARAHEGPRAASAARAMGASAYTMGHHVAFGGAPDLHTAAHEAAHIVQQRAGVKLAGNVGKIGDVYERHADAVAEQVVKGQSAEALLEQMAPLGGHTSSVQRQVVQRAPIETDYGKFDTTKYEDAGPAGSEYGVDIKLTFDPDEKKVDAKKIGLTQAVRSQLGGKAVDMFPITATRRVGSGTGEGYQIDRYGGNPLGNPLYAAKQPAAADKLGDTSTEASWGQHGWHYMDGTTKKHQEAILIDKPTLPGRGKNSSQMFETTALAVEGTQAGTYMGSVTWGWTVDGEGKFKRQPLTRKSKGTPSETFVEAAKQWNKTSVGGTVKTTADPTNVYTTSHAPSFTVGKDTEIQIIKAHSIKDNEVYDEVTIKSGGGDKIGSTGLIKVKDMKETGGTAVIKLPIPATPTKSESEKK